MVRPTRPVAPTTATVRGRGECPDMAPLSGREKWRGHAGSIAAPPEPTPGALPRALRAAIAARA